MAAFIRPKSLREAPFVEQTEITLKGINGIQSMDNLRKLQGSYKRKREDKEGFIVMKSTYNKLQTQYNDLMDKYNNSQSTCSTSVQECNERRNEENSTCQYNIDTLTKEKEEIQYDLDNSMNTINDKDTKINILNQELRKCEENIEDLEDELNNRKKQIENMENIIHDMENKSSNSECSQEKAEMNKKFEADRGRWVKEKYGANFLTDIKAILKKGYFSSKTLKEDIKDVLRKYGLY